jgi:hypothetical protein
MPEWSSNNDRQRKNKENVNRIINLLNLATERNNIIPKKIKKIYA